MSNAHIKLLTVRQEEEEEEEEGEKEVLLFIIISRTQSFCRISN